MEPKNKRFNAVATKAVNMADADWDKVKSYMVTPDKYERDDVRVFEALLAHNFIDRDKERFSKQTLQSLANSIVGKQTLQHHDKWSTAVGRFIDAELQNMSMDETLELVGSHPDKKIREKLARVEKEDGGLYWMAVKYYMAADDPLVRKIEMGIIGDMSISFVPIMRKEIRVDEKDRDPIWTEYQEGEDQKTEAIEGSLVFLGAQNGARVRKAAGDKEVDWDDLQEEFGELDAANVRQVLTEKFKKIEEQEMITLKMLDAEYVVEAEKPETIEAVQTAVGDKVKALTDEKDALTAEVDRLKADLDAANTAKTEAEQKAVDAEKVLNEAKEYREQLVAEAVKFGALTEMIDEKDVEAKKAAFMAMPMDALKEKLDEYKKIFVKMNPGKGEIETPKPKEPQKNMLNYTAPVI